MQLLALTGGIASGKSTVGRRLAALGAVRIDADELARDAVAPGSPGLDAVVTRFGADLRAVDGELDRAALGEIVFRDPQALADLNAIVHPEVRRLVSEQVAAARARDADAVVVYEIPLFVETGAHEGDSGFEWDMVVVADAPAETRVARMVELRGMAEDEARRRIANQASDAERRAVADVIIDTSGSEQHTLEQVDALWERLTSRP
ncbi:MAG: dephospho-CoA kinase [Leucobacter sp.]|nr:dephospho-CoA kinase [Leucobacter sp.]